MIENAYGNLLEADAEALVNTVNCVGVMGKGIALQFKQAFPDNFREYEKACRLDSVRPGTMLVHQTKSAFNPRFIINFPTKRHWKGNSRLSDIQEGLQDLLRVIRELDLQSIAVPPLGCGNGGLEWSVVEPIITKAFAEVPEVKVLLFAPQPVPVVAALPVGTKIANMTRARAVLVKLIEMYSDAVKSVDINWDSHNLGKIELQKLAYFLQVSGEPMRLQFAKGDFGPFAPNLHHLVEHCEGHFLRGYGDNDQVRTKIQVLPDGLSRAEEFLASVPDAAERLASIGKLIEGYESPYGLELLATVHWLTTEIPAARQSYSAAVEGIKSWNIRKDHIFTKSHVEKAWHHLNDLGWIDYQGASNHP